MSIAHQNELKDIPEATLAETAAWVSRLHGMERSANVEAGFQRWLAADPSHARAFESMTDIWNTVAGMPAGRFPRVGTRSGIFPGFLTHNDIARRWLVATAAVLIVGIGALFAYHNLRNPTYTTEVGKQQTIKLADGSRMVLNSNTRVITLFTDSARELKLIQGEAFFDVKPDPTRPFSVIVGDRKVTAVGTSFLVRHDAQQTAVTLIKGKVAVDVFGTNENEMIILSPGERYTLQAKSTIAVDRPKIEAVSAWQHGEVVLDRTPLADAAAEMNRYEKIPIVIDEPGIAGMQVSGNYKTGDSRGFAQSIAGLYGLQIREEDGRIYIASPLGEQNSTESQKKE